MIYNIKDLPQRARKGGGGEAPGKRDEMEIHILERGVLSPEVLGHLIMCS